MCISPLSRKPERQDFELTTYRLLVTWNRCLRFRAYAALTTIGCPAICSSNIPSTKQRDSRQWV